MVENFREFCKFLKVMKILQLVKFLITQVHVWHMQFVKIIFVKFLRNECCNTCLCQYYGRHISHVYMLVCIHIHLQTIIILDGETNTSTTQFIA